MSDWKAKRFWTLATVDTRSDGFGVSLDGRVLKTPAKATLVVPSLAMSEAIAAEWNAQEGEIDPRTMPVTQTANSAIDKVTLQKAEVADMLAAYGDSDLLCYRAEGPAGLVARQNEAWDPILEWGETEFGVRLHSRIGVMHMPQDPKALLALSKEVHALSVFELTAFHDLVSLSGSLLIGFAAARNAWDAESLWAASRVDETWQSDQWGKDDQAEAEAEIKHQAFLHAKRMFDFCSG